jgi:dolichol kinase
MIPKYLQGDHSIKNSLQRNHRKPSTTSSSSSCYGVSGHDSRTMNHSIRSPRALKSANRNNDLGVTTTTKTTTKSNRKIILAKAAAIYLTSCVLLAKLNLIGSDYTDSLIAKDFGVSLLTTVLALIFVKIITKLAAEGVLQARDSRKIIHMFSAPLFILFWPLFSDVWGARFFAAFVPALQALRLWFAGTGGGGGSSSSSSSGSKCENGINIVDYEEDDDDDDSTELANAISRSGARQEALGGPFIYVVILFSAIMLCFRDNLSGVVALSTMAAGDGMADIVGRRFGKNNKWFFNDNKSVAGSVGFVVTASICSIALAAWLMYTHAVTVGMSMSVVASRIVLISILSALVELLPGTDDNWSVPITAGVLSSLLIE